MQGHSNTWLLQGRSRSPVKLDSLPNPNNFLHEQAGRLLSDHAIISNIAESFHLCSEPSSTIYKKNTTRFHRCKSPNFLSFTTSQHVLADFSFSLTIQDIFVILCLKERRYFSVVLLSPYTCRSVLQTILCAPKQGYEQMEITATCSDSHFPFHSFPAAITSVKITSGESLCTFHLQLPLQTCRLLEVNTLNAA